jgi:hypothetical protein
MGFPARSRGRPMPIGDTTYFGHRRIRWLAGQPYEHICRYSFASVTIVGECLGSQLLIDGEAFWSDQDLGLRPHPLDVVVDRRVIRVFLRNLIATREHELPRVGAQALERNLRDPVLKIESVMSRHVLET